MLDFLFGEGQYGFRFLIAFVVVLALLGLFLWLLRRFGAERLGGPTARGRQPRLAVIDAAAVDGRRRLVLIRRDNVEHLIMIGGPSDIVIEPSIVRAAAAARDVGPPRAAAAHGDGAWMPQPEPAAAAPAMPRIVRPAQQPLPEEPMQWHGEPEPPPQPRQNRAPDPLAGLAAELSRNPPPQPEPAAPPPPQRPMRERPREAARDVEPPRPPVRQPQPAMPTETQFASPADQNLAEMAQRLEAALRRPVGRSEGRAPDSRPDGRAEGRQEPKLAAVPQPEPPPPEHELPPPDRREPRAAAAAQGKSPYDSLEQEMASLLGRNSKA